MAFALLNQKTVVNAAHQIISKLLSNMGIKHIFSQDLITVENMKC